VRASPLELVKQSVLETARERAAAREAELEEETLRERGAIHPVVFCRELLGFEPWSKQREILTSIRDHKRTAVRSSHGTGKTAGAGRAALWFLNAYRPSKVITTASVWPQVEHQLWPEIGAAYKGGRGLQRGRLSKTQLWLAEDWFALGLSTDEAERLAGYHSPHLLVIVDEASGVNEAIYEAIESLLTSEGSKLLLIGNPTQPAGTFYDAFHRNRALYSTIHISAFDCPAFTGEQVTEAAAAGLVTRAWVDEKRLTWGGGHPLEDLRRPGVGSPLWDVRVLGEFPRTSDDTAVALAAVEAAQEREAKPDSPFVVACDVARFGSDETVIAARRGPRVRLVESYVGKDTMETAGRILRVARAEFDETRIRPELVIDDDGVGGGVTDRLREIGEFTVRAFNGAHRARRPDEYPNRRSEAWFTFAEEALPSADLDGDEQLAADLVAPRYKIDSSGRRVLERKEETKARLGRSPDRGDAVVMAFTVSGEDSTSGERSEPGPETGVLDGGIRYGMSL
jgi:phage terminase large subunit